MKKLSKKFLVIVSLLLILPFWGCNSDSDSSTESLPNESSSKIESVPSSLGSQYTSNFDRYTKVETPSGGNIHIVAQSSITNEQIIRCRSILEHYLRNYEGSVYGKDKSAVANKMAENGAVLTLLNGRDDGSNPLEVLGQPLYQEEIQVEGHSWYINQNYEYRDASFEEILHMVHDYGIGVDGPGGTVGALPEFQAKIRIAQKNALSNNLWGIGAEEWISELTAENSLSQEYLAALIDVYYGLWGASTENSTHGMSGLYVAKYRNEIIAEDPVGSELLHYKFFHPYLTYDARIDPSFDGIFSLKYDKSIPYTNHSRYLKDITLLGSNNADVRINELDNKITGNSGINTVIFTGDLSEYSIVTELELTTVTDTLPDRDGSNRLDKIEKLQFADQIIEL